MKRWIRDRVYLFLLKRLNSKKYEVIRLRWQKARLQTALDKVKREAEGQANLSD